MFLTFEDEKCPVCGVLGKESEIEGLYNCPNCGTQFNEFSVIIMKEDSTNLHWN